MFYKNLKQSNKLNSGSSTIELLIAFGIMFITISGVILVVFSNQTVALDIGLTKEAVYKAKAIVEDDKAASRATFDDIESFTVTDGIYQKGLEVYTITPCWKQLSTKITWKSEFLRPQIVRLGTELTDVQEAMKKGGDCGGRTPPEDFQNPQTLNSVDIAQSGNPATGLDVLNKLVYLTAKSANPAQDD